MVSAVLGQGVIETMRLATQDSGLEGGLTARRPGTAAVRGQEPVRALTAIRGIAAWWIVGFHFREALPAGTPSVVMRMLDQGYLAVDLFFILSGYVICFNYSSWFAGRRFQSGVYARFLALRLSRLYPVHGFMLLLFLVNPVAVLIFSSHRNLGDLHWGYYCASLLLVQNWGLTPGLYWNVPAWSISAEWLAYLAFPGLAAFTAMLAGTTFRCLLLIAMLLASLAIAASVISPAGLGHGGQAFWSLRCLLEFTVGIGLGRANRSASRSRLDSRLALGIAGFCGALYAFTPMPDYVVVPFAFTAVVYGFIDERGWLPMLLRSRALQWLGNISYSTYMIHYFLKIWTKFILVRQGVPPALAFPAYVLAVLIGSALMHRLIERPGQRMARRYLASSSEIMARR